MQDYSSISVSSYEAGILADRLTEQSSEGWEVVAIVPTGSTVTAYLSRPASVAEQAADVEVATTESEPAPAVAETEPAAADPEPQPEPEPAVDDIAPEVADDAGWAALASEAADADETADDELAPSVPETATAIAGAAAVGEVADAVIEPEPATAEPAPQSTADVPADEPTPQSTADVPSAEPTPEAATATTTAAASGAAPAGWYADPSSRFELRYWDGTQWTEHVSRAGQQYTDPPVA